MVDSELRGNDLLTIQGLDSNKAEKINRILKEMLNYFQDAEKDSDDIYAVVFPEILVKTNRRKCKHAVKELYSWIVDEGFHILTSFHQYILYWIIEFCLLEEDAYNETALELGVKADELGLFMDAEYQHEHGDSVDLFLPCFIEIDPTEINIMLLQGMFDANIKLNKGIIDKASIAVVPVKSAANEPVDTWDVENDYIWFCFAKFTKTSLAIQKLIKIGLHEDALILTRSNYETLIHAKSVIVSPGTIDHFIEFKLGLENGIYKDTRKYDPRGYRIIVDKTDPEMTFSYTDNISKIAALAEESNSYQIYKYLCDLTHCDINTIGYYQEDAHYSYSGSSRKALMNSLLWNVFFNCKFYEVLLDGEMLDVDGLIGTVSDTFFEYSSALKEVLDMEILKAEVYSNYTDDEDMRTELNKYITNLSILRDENK